MPKAPPFASIPVPENNVDALYATCMALKRTMEMLISSSVASVQGGPPPNPTNGSLWIQPDTGRMSYWNGEKWVLLDGGTGGFGATVVNAQAIATAPGKLVLVNPPTFNRGNFYNSDARRFTPPAGMIQFNAQIQTVLNIANAIVNIALYKNGVLVGVTSVSGNNGQRVTANLSLNVQQTNPTDFYEVFIDANNAGMTVLATGSGVSAWGVGTGGV